MTRPLGLACCFVLAALACAAGAASRYADEGSTLALQPAVGGDAPKAQPAAATAIGAKVPAGSSLRDVRGNRRSLYDFKNNKAIVLVFLGTECPVSNLVVPGLIELEKSMRGKKVQFLAVYANENEDLEQIAVHAVDRDLPFIALRDSGQRLADSVGVTRVPSVAVLDGDFKLRYRGRVSDQYGAASKRPKETRADLAEALKEVLAGQAVSVAETETDGCLIDRARKAPGTTPVTYAKHVAPILQKHCQACHRPNQTAPFSLLNYNDAVKHSAMIREVTQERRMPPWHADPRYGHFSNERRLAAAEIETLSAWVDGGLLRGDDKDLPPPVQFLEGWTHGKPDLVIEMPEAYQVPADGVVPYKSWMIETKFTEDKWVRVAEGRPGSPGVVHHLVVYIIKKGSRGPADGMAVLVGWAPGDLGLVLPPDTALRIPKDASLKFEMHYTPNGAVVKDRSSVGITFAKEPPRYEMMVGEFANMAIELPAHDAHYKAEAAFRIREDARILSFAPHMHWRGKDYNYEVIYPDGKRQTLLSVPRWDFNWQSVYRFKEPFRVPKGSKLHSVAHWDNSAANPLNPDPSKSVSFGLQSWEEMMVGFMAFVWERPETYAELARNPPSQADIFFERFDVNCDDFITPDEIPSKFRTAFFLAAGGKNKLSRTDFTRIFETIMPKRDPKKEKPKKSSRVFPGPNLEDRLHDPLGLSMRFELSALDDLQLAISERQVAVRK